ncbi:MAG TPA: serine hydrolase domain-containing protein [Acidimicrobiia bacterium]|nr:serine hydrolase domain-containing protein [Acidimicrobiia bacterium]
MEALELIDSWDSDAAVIVVGREGELARRGPVTRQGRWASVTKLFTAYAILIAWEEGLLALDDPAGPEGSTVRHLLAHASGLPFEGIRPIAAPAQKRVYSNTGFDLLADVVSQRTGTGFEEFLRGRVLEPLEMNATLQDRPSQGLVGDTIGISRLGLDILDPRLLDPDTISDAGQAAFPGLDGVLPGVGQFEPLDWGLGFEIRSTKWPHWTGRSNSPATIGHFGGSGSFLWVDPEAGVALACLSDHEFGGWAMQAWPRLSDAVLKEFGHSPVATTPPR